MECDIMPILRSSGMMDFIHIGIIRHSLYVWDIILDSSIIGGSVEPQV
jgi:hypothetical protein